MTRDKIKKITEELDNYLDSRGRSEPLVYLYGEEKDDESYTPKVKPLSINSNESFGALLKVVRSYSDWIKKFIEDENPKDLEKDDDNNGPCYKLMDKEDLASTESLSNSPDNSLDFSDFIKPNKYKNTFLVVKINIDQGNKKIILLKSIVPTYYAKKNKFSISFFDNRQKVKFLDKQKDIIFDDNFDISALVDATGSFFFIADRKKFEDLYKYHDKYENAYKTLSKKLDFIDWETPDITISTKRNCYSIIAGFDELEECVEKVKSHLNSNEENDIKRALKSKNIQYTANGGGVYILPQTTSDIKHVLKIIKDGVAKTQLLNRTVIVSDFEGL